jgi:hypothetical protein
MLTYVSKHSRSAFASFRMALSPLMLDYQIFNIVKIRLMSISVEAERKYESPFSILI